MSNLFAGAAEVGTKKRKRSYFNCTNPSDGSRPDVPGVYTLKVLSVTNATKPVEGSRLEPFFGADFKILEYPEGAPRKPNDEVSFHRRVPLALLQPAAIKTMPIKQREKEEAKVKFFFIDIKNLLLSISGLTDKQWDDGMPDEAGSEENPLAGRIVKCQLNISEKGYTDQVFLAADASEQEQAA